MLTSLANRRIAVMLPLGFASGLPLALTTGTLQAWLSVAGVDLKTIGIFTLVGLPYTLKFLWAPVMDRFVPPWLGRRRGWMLATQITLMVGVAVMAAIDPARWPWWMGLAALVVAFTSASQDIVFDAYRTDTLRPQERGFGAAVWVNGYRLAMIVSAVLALILAERIGWANTYLVMVGFMTIGVAAILTGPEPECAQESPASIQEAFLGPIVEFFHRGFGLQLVLLVALYKIGDAFAGALQTAFFIRGVGFSAADVGYMKGLGIGLTLVGALAGGVGMTRLGLVRSLLIFGALQALSNLSFVLLASAGKSYPLLVFAIASENLTGGMGTAAFVALVMALCHHKYTATQFALLSSVEALGRVLLGRPSADLVDWIGWGPYFLVTFFASIPGLYLVWSLRSEINRAEHVQSSRGAVASEPV
ncbi:AmpG family muropeptide MFS transporter [Nitrospira sp.]|nr:AmpG family muropeptide MFS transporter [Nitrospira sp.]